jgi:hypothetical protein
VALPGPHFPGETSPFFSGDSDLYPMFHRQHLAGEKDSPRHSVHGESGATGFPSASKSAKAACLF